MVYIGQTVDAQKRRSQHKSKSENKHLRNAIALYGWHQFTFEIIDFAFNKAQANCIEDCLIIYHDARNPNKGYNVKPGGNSWDDAYRLERSIAMTGELNPFFGQTHTDEQKAIWSETRTGMTSPNKGKQCTPQQLEQLRLAGEKGRACRIYQPHTESTKAKISQSKIGTPGPNLGKTFSEDHKAKLSAAKLGKPRKPFTPETIEKIRAAAILREANKKLPIF
jgi:group I intron endonuclease